MEAYPSPAAAAAAAGAGGGRKIVLRGCCHSMPSISARGRGGRIKGREVGRRGKRGDTEEGKEEETWRRRGGGRTTDEEERKEEEEEERWRRRCGHYGPEWGG